VAAPVVREVVEWDEYTGRLGAVESVDVRARVSGYLESIHFKDGEVVNKGDTLFVIDPRPFKASLAAAEGDALAFESRLALARNDLERANTLVQSKAISREDFDTRAKEADAAAASLQAAKARIESARLDVEFTEVRAPMGGRIGRHEVSVGNLVSGGTANSTVLANIVTTDPLYCYFDVDEQAYLRYIRLIKSGQRESSRTHPTPVRVALLDETEFTHEGRMNFVDNQIDQLTGTLRGRAVLDNSDLALIPGVFVRLQMPGSAPFRAVLVPDRAIGADQSDRFVFVVDDKNVVRQKVISLGRIIDGLRVVRGGLDGSETVVVDGIGRVRVGQAVTPERVAPVPAASQPAAVAGNPAPAAGGGVR
jgi:multidrug efflux system membrane fusion protein